ncbi:translation initiation factor IF-2-like [Microtus oregoni]|uniref:translation initiation factor IF-2-like n=1 Tax=Microtus oregoni TaxID=111838 RepID=UPI001BB1144C|nr:translation initiation factor IF-2-like [Microtus oregoni]
MASHQLNSLQRKGASGPPPQTPRRGRPKLKSGGSGDETESSSPKPLRDGNRRDQGGGTRESAAAGARPAPSGLAGWRRGPGRGARRVGGRDRASPEAGRPLPRNRRRHGQRRGLVGRAPGPLPDGPPRTALGTELCCPAARCGSLSGRWGARGTHIQGRAGRAGAGHGGTGRTGAAGLGLASSTLTGLCLGARSRRRGRSRVVAADLCPKSHRLRIGVGQARVLRAGPALRRREAEKQREPDFGWLLATLGTEDGCLSRMNFQKPRKKKRCSLLHEAPEPPASGIGLCCVPALRPSELLMSKFLNGPCSHLPAQVSSTKQTGHARGVLGSHHQV